MTKKKIISLVIISASFAFFCFHNIRAEELVEIINEQFHISLDQATIAKGYTVSAFGEKIKLSLVPGILSESTEVDALVLREPIDLPWQLEKISEIYQFEFKNKAAYDNHKPFYIQISYDQADNNLKKVYFFDKNFNGWRPLPTRDYPDKKFVRSLIHLPFARMAVFSYPGILTTGKASWYAYKGGNFAASPDFPKGSRLRVYNQDNGKFVDVIVNDWGPERDKFPDRAIDLDKIAFSKIASLGAGVINVVVEPLEIVTDEQGRELGVSLGGATSEFKINAKSAIAINEADNQILWSQNATTSRPLASLTKLIAVKTFLDTHPTLSSTIAYSNQDAKYNYEYCKPWESAELSLKDGEVVTLENLVYGSLIGSTNNTIETLVRASGLARADFIKKMNESVLAWGATSTFFVEPTGLSPENVSSAADYAIILKAVLTNPIIQKSSTMDRYNFTTVNTKRTLRVTNTNKIIHTNQFEFTGSKTGYLDEAGYCLAVRVKNLSHNIIAVTLGADTREQSFSETTDLLRYAVRQLIK